MGIVEVDTWSQTYLPLTYQVPYHGFSVAWPASLISLKQELTSNPPKTPNPNYLPTWRYFFGEIFHKTRLLELMNIFQGFLVKVGELFYQIFSTFQFAILHPQVESSWLTGLRFCPVSCYAPAICVIALDNCREAKSSAIFGVQRPDVSKRQQTRENNFQRFCVTTWNDRNI